ncbi:MAG: hypothetical protein DI624_04195 [Brevundimonas sp.]|uniref:hypothetical protein n=1 Tax=Brevundimonas sp. TaxID=1871086 RepID=UPI000DB5B50B|nr:hypothetical protein [Brevundimonas sp.]PZT99880.1 MAG: hypothetical protein DI624_04195 [Brevundimonas sp.]
MIRQNKAGVYYCDGRECGYELSYSPPTDEDHAEVHCLDCGAGLFINNAAFKRDASARAALKSTAAKEGEKS